MNLLGWRWNWQDTHHRRWRWKGIKHRRPRRWRHRQHWRRRNAAHYIWPSRYYSSRFLSFIFKCKLQKELFSIPIPVCPKFIVHLFDFSARYFECYSFVWFSSEQQVLPFAIWWLYFLLVSRHETVSWINIISNLCKKIVLLKTCL